MASAVRREEKRSYNSRGEMIPRGSSTEANRQRRMREASERTEEGYEKPTKDLSVAGAINKIKDRKSRIDQAIEDAGG